MHYGLSANRKDTVTTNGMIRKAARYGTMDFSYYLGWTKLNGTEPCSYKAAGRKEWPGGGVVPIPQTRTPIASKLPPDHSEEKYPFEPYPREVKEVPFWVTLTKWGEVPITGDPFNKTPYPREKDGPHMGLFAVNDGWPVMWTMAAGACS